MLIQIRLYMDVQTWEMDVRAHEDLAQSVLEVV
jgi:hypothetical protein